MKKIFITSVTGTQGGKIANSFKNAGFKVSSITRQDIDLGECEFSVGDFSDTPKLASLMKNSEAVVLTLPLIFDSESVSEITHQIITGAKAENVNKIIFNTSIPLGQSKTGYAAIDVKHDALNILKESGLDIITLMPTIYLDNLASPFLLPVIKDSRTIPYPIPNDIEFEWISQENLGRYCVAALEEETLIGEKILITNRDRCSKNDIAKLIGNAQKTKISYFPIPPDQFEQNLIPVLGEYVAREIANLYRGVNENKNDFINYSHEEFLSSVELQTTAQWVNSIKW